MNEESAYNEKIVIFEIYLSIKTSSVGFRSNMNAQQDLSHGLVFIFSTYMAHNPYIEYAISSIQ